MKTCNHPTCGDECRRTPKKLNRYSKPKPMSTKRGKEIAEYIKEKKAFMEANPVCRAQIPGLCTHTATQIHHMAGRENDLLLEKSLWLPICHNCHEWATVNSRQAITMGISVSKHKKAS